MAALCLQCIYYTGFNAFAENPPKSFVRTFRCSDDILRRERSPRRCLVLSGQESGVTPLVLAKGITNTALGSGNAINNNLALDWASVLGNTDLGWVNGLAYNMEYGNKFRVYATIKIIII